MEKVDLVKYGYTFAREMYDSEDQFPLVQFVNDCLMGRLEISAPHLIQIVNAYRNLVHMYGTREVDAKQGAVSIGPAPF